jgi:hypothetical protein
MPRAAMMTPALRVWFMGCSFRAIHAGPRSVLARSR